ncbi:unnamed protein product [Rhodiola kirilowii]
MYKQITIGFPYYLKIASSNRFPGKDQPFIKLFVDTQLFSVLSDFRLSTFEHE